MAKTPGGGGRKPAEASDSAGAAVSSSAARKRRTLIGANVVVAVALAAALLVAVNFISWWLTDEHDMVLDVTSDSYHSFSTRTHTLLGNIDGTVYLTSFFRAADNDPEAMHRRVRQINDLLGQYERIGQDVEVQNIDPERDIAAVSTVAERLMSHYQDETQPYENLVDDFLAYKPQLVDFLTSQREFFLQASELATDPNLRRDLQLMAEDFAATVSERPVMGKVPSMQEVEIGINFLLGRTSGTGPVSEQAAGEGSLGYGFRHYSDAASVAADHSRRLAALLKNFATNVERKIAEQGMRMLPELQEMLRQVPERYAQVETKLLTFPNRLAELPPLEYEQVTRRLGPNSVLIEAGGRATVVTADELYPVRTAGQAEVEAVFAGEEVVTAALLRLTVTNRPVAMFVKPDGRRPVSEKLPEFAAIIEELRRANFVIENWDLSASQQMPRPQSEGPIVLIVMVPEPTMPAPRAELYEPVAEFIAGGGDALFFARGTIAGQVFTQGFLRGVPPQATYSMPYLDLLGKLGIKVRTDLAVVHQVETPAGLRQVFHTLESVEYPSEGSRQEPHAIVQPLQGLGGRFDYMVPIEYARPDAGQTDVVAGPADNSTSDAAGNSTGDAAPDLQWWPLVSAPASKDYWGESNIMGLMQRQDQQFNPESDKPAPFPVAVAATIKRPDHDSRHKSDAADEPWSPVIPGSRRDTEARRREAENPTLTLEQAVNGPEETRLAVFGGDMFMASPYLLARVQDVPAYPANAELLVNTLYWLAGQEELIGLSPQAQQSRRLGAMGSSRTAVMWMLWLGMPLAVLIMGVGVWISRRR